MSIALLRAAAHAGTPTYAFVRDLMGLGPPTNAPVPSFSLGNDGRHGGLV